MGRALVDKMLSKLVTVLPLALLSHAAPQFTGDSSLARILQEQRFNMGDGKFGSAFAQEDGHAFKEESAGVNGFRILEGAHIPSGGQTSAQAELKNEVGEPKEYEYEYYDDTIPESPFVNPFDPSHQLPMLKAGDLAGHLAQRKFTTPLPLAPGQTTPPPTRFFPKGQIKLDRFPQGFNFQFQS